MVRYQYLVKQCGGLSWPPTATPGVKHYVLATLPFASPRGLHSAPVRNSQPHSSLLPPVCDATSPNPMADAPAMQTSSALGVLTLAAFYAARLHNFFML